MYNLREWKESNFHLLINSQVHRPSSYTPIICCSYRNWTYDLFLVRELFLTTELRSNEVVSLTSNYSKEGSSKSSTLWKHENIVWTLWDLNSSKTLQMSCANLITLQSPFKYGYLDLNQGQLAPKASILPTELHPYMESIVLKTNTLLWYSLFSR